MQQQCTMLHLLHCIALLLLQTQLVNVSLADMTITHLPISEHVCANQSTYVQMPQWCLEPRFVFYISLAIKKSNLVTLC